jgi:hypothetical protein
MRGQETLRFSCPRCADSDVFTYSAWQNCSPLQAVQRQKALQLGSHALGRQGVLQRQVVRRHTAHQHQILPAHAHMKTSTCQACQHQLEGKCCANEVTIDTRLKRMAVLVQPAFNRL